MNQVATPVKITDVQVSGVLESGETVSQTYNVEHPSGEPDAVIHARALQVLKQNGGIIVFSENGDMDFYLGSKFTGSVHFSIKKVALIGSGALTEIKQHAQRLIS